LNDKRKTWCWRDGLKLSIFPPSSPSWEQIKNKEKKKKKTSQTKIQAKPQAKHLFKGIGSREKETELRNHFGNQVGWCCLRSG
jgi:hypothetical protein